MKRFYLLITGIPLLIMLCAFIYQSQIDGEKIKAAGEIIGITFSQEEIDLMSSDVEDQYNAFINNRSHQVSNDVPPALIFNPLPLGYHPPQEENEFLWSKNEHTQWSGNMDELAFMSIGQLSSLIHDRKVSAEALANFYIQRLKTFDPQLHCVITMMEERAIAQARKMDKELAAGKSRGLLHGIPCGIKDLLATKDYKTTWGATPYKDQIIPYDAEVVKRLEKAGAIIVAKLSMGALAWGDVWYKEKTRNPWDLESGSSGSSAGSASAVAAGLLPFAIGTETLGSIVSPSTVCGVTGLRPTFGRVSRYGAMALSWSMDKIGPICRTAEDCLIVLQAISGADPKDPFSIEASLSYNSELPLSNLKVGYVKSEFEESYSFKHQDSLALEVFKKLGIQLIPITLPEYEDIGFILEAEAAAAFDELTTSGMDDSLVRQVRNAWPNVFRAARLIPAVEYIKANRYRFQLIEKMHELFQDIDVILHPSWATSALRIGNLTGHPAIVIPNGFKEGKPTSITITGKLFDEGTLVRLAKAYQDHTEHHAKHPEL